MQRNPVTWISVRKTAESQTENGGTGLNGFARRGQICLLVFLLGLSTTVWLARAVKTDVDAAIQQDFEFLCRELVGQLQNRILAHEQILRGAAAFFADTDGVTREEWRAFVEDQTAKLALPGIQGLGFSLLIPREKLAQHIQEIRAEGFPTYNVRPEGEREFYTSVIFIEPFTNRNLRAFGYDMLSEPVRRAAMERARDQDAAALTGKVRLVQETDQGVQAGALMVVPVYRMGASHGTVPERRAALIGWAYSPYRMNDFMQGILGHWVVLTDRRIRLQIFDGEQATPETLLYDSRSVANPQDGSASRFTWQNVFDFAGHPWTVRFTTFGRPLSARDYRTVWFVLIGGIIASLLLSGLVLQLLKSRFMTKQMARQLMDLRTIREQIQNERSRLQGIIDGTHAGTWEWNIQTGEIVYNERWANMLGYTLAELAPISMKTWETLVHPDDLKNTTEMMERHIAGEFPYYNCECRLRHKDGSWVWAHDLGRVITRTRDGKPVMMFGTHTDITERRQAEARIREKDIQFRKLSANLPDMIYQFTRRPDGSYCVPIASAGIQNIFGCSPEDVRKDFTPIGRVIVPEDAVRVIDNIENSAKHMTPFACEFRVQIPGKSIQWTFSRAIPERLEDGSITWYGFSVDITEKKRAEEGRETSSEILRILNNSLSWPDSIQGILAVLKRWTGCDAVGLRLQEGDDYPYFAQDGFSQEFLSTENTLVERDKDGGICRDKDGHPFLDCTCGLVLSGKTDPSNPLFTRGGSFWTNDSFPLLDLPADQDPRRHPRNRCMREGYASMALIPIRDHTSVVGLIHLSDRRKGLFTLVDIQQFEVIAQNIGDVLMRRQVDQKLKEANELTNVIVENIPLMVFLKESTDLRFVVFNRAGEELLGYDRKVLMGNNNLDLFPPEQAACFMAKDREVLDGEAGMLEIPEETISTAKKGERILHTRKICVRGEGGKKKYLLGISEDITDRKKAETELVIARELAEKANRVKSQFLAAMSHELRTPLNPILGFSELLSEAPNMTEEQRVWLRIITQRGKDLLDLIGSVLDLSKIEADRIIIRRELLPLRRTVKDLVESMFPMVRKKALRMEWNVEAELPDNLLSDGLRLRQVLLNLLNNAIKFTERGGIVVRVQDGRASRRVHEVADGDAALLFSVEDTGIGIPLDRHAAIFEAFTQADLMHAVKYGGTGLGLTIAGRLVELMGGQIWVESVPGKGSKFCFTVMVGVSRAALEEVRKPDVALDPPEKCSLNVLIVDDDPTSLKMASIVVQQAGHRIQTATDGRQAVSLTKAENFDLVLMDVQMPIMDGVEAARAIREQDKTLGRHTRIIALTAYAMQDDRDLLMNVGMDDYLSKPIAAAALRGVLVKERVAHPSGVQSLQK